MFRNFPARLEKFRAKGNALVGDVHPDAVNVAGAIDAGAGRRGADDDNDVDEQYGEGGADAASESDSADDFGGRAVWLGWAVTAGDEAAWNYRRNCQREERCGGDVARVGISRD